MDLSVHLVVSLIFISFLLPVFGWFSVLVLIGGFLVDIDHYLLYVIVKKDFGLARARRFYKDREFVGQRPVLHILHTVEPLMITFILGILVPWSMPIFLGYLLHLMMDIWHNAVLRRWDDRALSTISWIVKRVARG